MIPKWYQLAVQELGTTEGKGAADNPRVIEYHKATGLAASEDSVPWCGSFVAWLMLKSGLKYRMNTAASARDWLKWGVGLKEPVIGAVGVILRGQSKTAGHVFLFAGWANDARTRFKAIGGNQGGSKASGHDGAVTMTEFSVAQVLGWRWPEEVKLPVANQPLSKSGVLHGATGVLATGGTLIVANGPELGDAIQKAADPASIVEKVQANAPVLVEAVEKSESLRASGTIIGAVVGLLLIGLAVWVIMSRINGSKAEREHSAE